LYFAPSLKCINLSTTQPMKTKFHAFIALLEKVQADLFEKLKSESAATINTKPTATAWSIGETLNHIQLSEAATLAYLQKKVLDIENTEMAGNEEAIRFELLKKAILSTQKFNAPLNVIPAETTYSLDVLNEALTNTRNQLTAFINGLADEDLNRTLYKHPGIGRMNLIQMTEFLLLHAERHHLQINNTLALLKNNI
jgi:DinB superfamily